jgi:hypothetical protein
VSYFEKKVVKAAEKAVQRIIDTALSGRSQGAVIGVAPAGAGKSYAIGTAVLAARKKKRKVVVATPTNEQAYALVSGLADRVKASKSTDVVTFLPASSRALPPEHCRANAVEAKASQAGAAAIRVGTLDKLGDAWARGDLVGADLLLIDEAYQANAVHYYKVGAIADRHLLMGDSGQLAPFSTAPEADRWRGLSEDPLLRAVEVLDRNHPSTPKERLPITRRLDPRAVPVVSAFYPDHPFAAAIKAGVRDLELKAGGGRGWALEDKVLEYSRTAGWAHVEMPASVVLLDDPEIADLLVRLAMRLLARKPRTVCENSRKKSRLRATDIAVVVSHNAQKDRLKALMQAAGLEDVVVSTANKVQGLTFQVVLAWHPLAGLQESDEFHLDPGRMCVMLTRHRHACIVVGRAGDRALVEGIPPATPAYTGWDLDPALDGWYAHEGVFRALEQHRIEVP